MDELFRRYAELLRRAWLNPSYEPWQRDVRDFERLHAPALDKYWKSWQENTKTPT